MTKELAFVGRAIICAEVIHSLMDDEPKRYEMSLQDFLSVLSEMAYDATHGNASIADSIIYPRGI